MEENVKQNWIKKQVEKLKKNHSNSELFWSSILYILYIIVLFINVEIALALSAFGSLLMFAMVIDGDIKEEDCLWFYLTFLYYIVIAIVFVIIFFDGVYKKTFGRFNKWLDNKKK